MNFLKNISGLLLIAVAFISCGNQENSSEKQQQGTQAMQPSNYVEQASFEDFDGNTVELSEFKGKVVLIDFWETWCKPCLESFPTMQRLMSEYPDDFVVLAVTPGFADTKEDAQKFISNHDYDFVYLLDSNKLHQKLQVQGIPYKVFVDAEGNYIESSMGSNGPKGDYKKAASLIEKYKDS